MGVMLSCGWNPLLAKNSDMPEESDVAVCTVPSYPSIGLGREVEGGLVLAGEECQGARRGLVERGGGDT